ncbi:MAG: hypothetical protein HFF18_10290 [Oscillospiraceae bacterium]|nr:hypothetical protein [Oscillospiraceae bacterium]
MKQKKFILALALTLLCGITIGANASNGLQTISAYLNSNVTVKLDGEAQTFLNEQGNRVYPITYNGSTYLPVRAVAGLVGLDVEWDQATQTVLLGHTKGVDLIDTLKPYDTYQAIHVQSEERKTQDISGKSYSHWLMMDGYFAATEIATSVASYNLEGKYETLTFQYYSDCDCTLQVLGDNDSVLAEISVKGGQVAQSITVNLLNSIQLTFKTEGVFGDANAFIFDAYLDMEA